MEGREGHDFGDFGGMKVRSVNNDHRMTTAPCGGDACFELALEKRIRPSVRRTKSEVSVHRVAPRTGRRNNGSKAAGPALSGAGLGQAEIGKGTKEKM